MATNVQDLIGKFAAKKNEDVVKKKEVENDIASKLKRKLQESMSQPQSARDLIEKVEANSPIPESPENKVE